ncbi:hypothetical protein EI555_017078, partial [Monodon monoceros]
ILVDDEEEARFPIVLLIKFLECAVVKLAKGPSGTVQSTRNSGNSQIGRVSAGLLIKNSLSSEDPNIKAQQQQNGFPLMLMFDQEAKNYFADFNNVTNSNSTEHMKESTLDAICYICQDIQTEQLQVPSNEILTAIILGKWKEYPNNNVKLVATKAHLEYWRIKFWSNVCDDKIDLVIEAKETAEQRMSQSTQQDLCQGNTTIEVPILTQTLTKDDENDDSPGHLITQTGGKFCKLLHEAAISDVCSVPLLQCLRESLSTEPRMASNNLLVITDRPDGHQNNLRSASYEALMKIVKNSTKYYSVQKLMLATLTAKSHQDEMRVSLLRIFQSRVGYGGCKRVNKSKCDIVDYLNELREDCLEAYSVVVKDQRNKDLRSRVYLSLSTMLDLRIIQRVLGTGAAEPIRNLFTTFGKKHYKKWKIPGETLENSLQRLPLLAAGSQCQVSQDLSVTGYALRWSHFLFSMRETKEKAIAYADIQRWQFMRLGQ